MALPCAFHRIGEGLARVLAILEAELVDQQARAHRVAGDGLLQQRIQLVLAGVQRHAFEAAGVGEVGGQSVRTGLLTAWISGLISVPPSVLGSLRKFGSGIGASSTRPLESVCTRYGPNSSPNHRRAIGRATERFDVEVRAGQQAIRLDG